MSDIKEDSDSEDDRSSMERPENFAVVTLQDTDEVMVAASEWLNTDKTQCQWPPFRSAEKLMQAVRNRIEPSAAWEPLNIHFHAEYETCEEAINKQEELVQAQKYGMYAAITLQESKELTVVPTSWLNEQKTQCYWPPFKSPEKFLEAVKKRHEPERGEKPWEMLNIVFHTAYATYEEAKEKHETVSDQKEQQSTSEKLQPKLISRSTQSIGIKRKRDESPDIGAPSLLTTSDMDPRKKAKLIMERIHSKVQAIRSTDETITALKTHIVDTISRMEEGSRKKATIGVFGRTGEGKSFLLNAVLEEKSLLPSGGFGACTAVITHVEANLNDSNYIAEIELISNQEWENEIVSSNKIENMDSQMTETTKERITALYGDDAENKTLEELKREANFIEVDNVLSDRNEEDKKIISNSDPSEFANYVVRYLEHSSAGPGGWYWPLVKSVTIKIPNCREHLEHIVLIDIPGTGDCNKIRDDLWKSKLRDCTSVWIVSDIKRAITDKDPWEIVEHCIEDLGPGGECKHINFICTKTDDIRIKEYLRSSKFMGPEISEDDLDVETKCILHRNNRAKEAIQKKLESSKSEESKERFITDVFTVSSRAYFDEKSHLKPSDTEIPNLRDLLKRLNKSIEKKLTTEYVNEAKGVLSLIQSVQLGTDENMTKARVLEDLQRSLKKELKTLDDRINKLYCNLEECLSRGVEKSEKLCVKTTHDMLSSVRPKTNKGFHKIYRAICEREGCYWPNNWNEPIDLNKFLTKHMYDNINQEFDLMFPIDENDKTEKSMQAQVDKFNVSQCVIGSPVLYPVEIFIKTQETKLRASLGRHIINKKKDIYSSIKTTIQQKMAPGYKKAAKGTGVGCMERMEGIITETIVEQLKNHMFNEAKSEALKMFSDLKVYILKTLESELMNSVERFLSQTSNISLMDVSREIEELERLSQQLSD